MYCRRFALNETKIAKMLEKKVGEYNVFTHYTNMDLKRLELSTSRMRTERSPS